MKLEYINSVLLGVDIEPLFDPLAYSGGQFDVNHNPPIPQLIQATTKLEQGDRIHIDYYSVIPINGCMKKLCNQ